MRISVLCWNDLYRKFLVRDTVPCQHPEQAHHPHRFRAMHHDEKRFPTPESFDPFHFLNTDGTLNENIPSPTQSGALGFGRRICPGRHFSTDSVWLSIACVLSTFNLRRAKDERGNDIVPTAEYSTGLLRFVEPCRSTYTVAKSSVSAIHFRSIAQSYLVLRPPKPWFVLVTSRPRYDAL